MKAVELNPALHAPRGVVQKPPSEEALKAAREFESLLLRHVLKSLEKTTNIGPASQSSSTYKSMIVDALSDGIGQSGGLGLADLLARDLEVKIGNQTRSPEGGPGTLSGFSALNSAQASEKPAVHTTEGDSISESPRNGESR